MVQNATSTCFEAPSCHYHGQCKFSSQEDFGRTLLCVKDKHFFLPLPPYSPDLNPIEQAWAVLKKKVTDLLREVPNIFEPLECFFQTKYL